MLVFYVFTESRSSEGGFLSKGSMKGNQAESYQILRNHVSVNISAMMKSKLEISEQDSSTAESHATEDV